MRAIVIGSVESTRICLRALGASGGVDLAAVVTLPAQLAHRHSDYVDLSGEAAAGTMIVHAADANAPEVVAKLDALAADYLFVVGWSQICGAPLRATGRRGAIGFHPAPLPQLRGRAVIPWTILQREPRTGSTLFWLDDGVDTGPILAQLLFDLESDETARSLYDKHMRVLAAMLPDVVAQLGRGDAARIPQDASVASWCARRTPEDGLIDWRERAEDVLLLIRAVGPPYPGAFTQYEGRRLQITSAALYPRSSRYVGLPGQVQALQDGDLIIRCGDGVCLRVTGWQLTGGGRPRLHAKLGTPR